jgi:hypothetical protein
MSDDETEDEGEFFDALAALRASIDQLVAVAPEQARAAWGLYSAFRAEGFTDSQAFEIVLTYVGEWATPDD